MLSPFLNEKIFVYNPKELLETLRTNLNLEYPFYFNIIDGNNIFHDFMSWALKKSFSEVTGIDPEGFMRNSFCESIYNEHRFVIETFMFNVVRELGRITMDRNIKFNLVLTYERLYIITF